MANFFFNPQDAVQQKPARVQCPWCRSWWVPNTQQEILTAHVQTDHPVQFLEWTFYLEDIRQLNAMYAGKDDRK